MANLRQERVDEGRASLAFSVIICELRAGCAIPVEVNDKVAKENVEGQPLVQDGRTKIVLPQTGGCVEALELPWIRTSLKRMLSDHYKIGECSQDNTLTRVKLVSSIKWC